MRRNLRGLFWLMVGVLFGLTLALCLVLVVLYDWAVVRINRKFDELFEDL